METVPHFDFYIKFTKPLILNLPKINDRVLAAAWVKRLKDDSSSEEKIKLDYLKLLLFVLQRKTLTDPFTEHPNAVDTLKAFPENQTLVDAAKKIIEKEHEERVSKYKKGESGDYPPYISDFSADLLEYVAIQDIKNFGVHAYFALSKLPLSTWYRVDKDFLPKAAKSMIEVSPGSPPLLGTTSSPHLIEKPPEPKEIDLTSGIVDGPPPSSPVQKSPKKSTIGATPPSRPIGKISPPAEDREPPTWGSNLLEVKHVLEDEEAPETDLPLTPETTSGAEVLWSGRSPEPDIEMDLFGDIGGFMSETPPSFLDTSLSAMPGTPAKAWDEAASLPYMTPPYPAVTPPPPGKPTPIRRVVKRAAPIIKPTRASLLLQKKIAAASAPPPPPPVKRSFVRKPQPRPSVSAKEQKPRGEVSEESIKKLPVKKTVSKQKGKSRIATRAAPVPSITTDSISPFRGYERFNEEERHLLKYKQMLKEFETEYEKDKQDYHKRWEEQEQVVAAQPRRLPRPKSSWHRVSRRSASIPKAHDAAVSLDQSIHISNEAREILEEAEDEAAPSKAAQSPRPELRAGDYELDEFEEMERQMEQDMQGAEYKPRDYRTDEIEPRKLELMGHIQAKAQEQYESLRSPTRPAKDQQAIDNYNQMIQTAYENDDFEGLERMMAQDQDQEQSNKPRDYRTDEIEPRNLELMGRIQAKAQAQYEALKSSPGPSKDQRVSDVYNQILETSLKIEGEAKSDYDMEAVEALGLQGGVDIGDLDANIANISGNLEDIDQAINFLQAEVSSVQPSGPVNVLVVEPQPAPPPKKTVKKRSIPVVRQTKSSLLLQKKAAKAAEAAPAKKRIAKKRSSKIAAPSKEEEEAYARALQTALSEDDFEAIERLVEEEMKRKGEDPNARPKKTLNRKKLEKGRKRYLQMRSRADAQLAELEDEETRREEIGQQIEDLYNRLQPNVSRSQRTPPMLSRHQEIRELAANLPHADDEGQEFDFVPATDFFKDAKKFSPRKDPRAKTAKELFPKIDLPEEEDFMFDELPDFDEAFPEFSPEKEKKMMDYMKKLQTQAMGSIYEPSSGVSPEREKTITDIMKQIDAEISSASPAKMGVPVTTPRATATPRRHRFTGDIINELSPPDALDTSFTPPTSPTDAFGLPHLQMSPFRPKSPRKAPIPSAAVVPRPRSPRLTPPAAPSPPVMDLEDDIFITTPPGELLPTSPEKFYYSPEQQYYEIKTPPEIDTSTISPKNLNWRDERDALKYKLYGTPKTPTIFDVPYDRLAGETPPELAPPDWSPLSPPIDAAELRQEINKEMPQKLPYLGPYKRRIGPKGKLVKRYSFPKPGGIQQMAIKEETPPRPPPRTRVLPPSPGTTPPKLIPDLFDLPEMHRRLVTESPPEGYYAFRPTSPEELSPLYKWEEDIRSHQVDYKPIPVAQSDLPRRVKTPKSPPKKLSPLSEQIENLGPEEWEQRNLMYRRPFPDLMFKKKKIPKEPPLAEEIEYDESPLTRRTVPISPGGQEGPRRKALRKKLTKKRLDFSQPQSPDESEVHIENLETEVEERDLSPLKGLELSEGFIERLRFSRRAYQPTFGSDPNVSPRTPPVNALDLEEMPEDINEILQLSPQSPMSEYGVMGRILEEVKQHQMVPRRKRRPTKFKELIESDEDRLVDVAEDPLEERAALIHEQIEAEVEQELAEQKAAEWARIKTHLDEALPAGLPSPLRPQVPVPFYTTPPDLRRIVRKSPPKRMERIPATYRDVLQYERMPELVETTPPQQSARFLPMLTALGSHERRQGRRSLEFEDQIAGEETSPRFFPWATLGVGTYKAIERTRKKHRSDDGASNIGDQITIPGEQTSPRFIPWIGKAVREYRDPNRIEPRGADVSNIYEEDLPEGFASPVSPLKTEAEVRRLAELQYAQLVTPVQKGRPRPKPMSLGSPDLAEFERLEAHLAQGQSPGLTEFERLEAEMGGGGVANVLTTADATPSRSLQQMADAQYAALRDSPEIRRQSPEKLGVRATPMTRLQQIANAQYAALADTPQFAPRRASPQPGPSSRPDEIEFDYQEKVTEPKPKPSKIGKRGKKDKKKKATKVDVEYDVEALEQLGLTEADLKQLNLNDLDVNLDQITQPAPPSPQHVASIEEGPRPPPPMGWNMRWDLSPETRVNMRIPDVQVERSPLKESRFQFEEVKLESPERPMHYRMLPLVMDKSKYRHFPYYIDPYENVDLGLEFEKSPGFLAEGVELDLFDKIERFEENEGAGLFAHAGLELGLGYDIGGEEAPLGVYGSTPPRQPVSPSKLKGELEMHEVYDPNTEQMQKYLKLAGVVRPKRSQVPALGTVYEGTPPPPLPSPPKTAKTYDEVMAQTDAQYAQLMSLTPIKRSSPSPETFKAKVRKHPLMFHGDYKLHQYKPSKKIREPLLEIFEPLGAKTPRRLAPPPVVLPQQRQYGDAIEEVTPPGYTSPVVSPSPVRPTVWDLPAPEEATPPLFYTSPSTPTPEAQYQHDIWNEPSPLEATPPFPMSPREQAAFSPSPIEIDPIFYQLMPSPPRPQRYIPTEHDTRHGLPDVEILPRPRPKSPIQTPKRQVQKIAVPTSRRRIDFEAPPSSRRRIDFDATPPTPEEQPVQVLTVGPPSPAEMETIAEIQAEEKRNLSPILEEDEYVAFEGRTSPGILDTSPIQDSDIPEHLQNFRWMG